jgi:hypothetical protein
MGAIPTHTFINDNCINRIKPLLLRDVKTEALLVFARTALERYFTKLDESNIEPIIGNNEETIYIYSTLRTLLARLQECVVNVDYLINLVQVTKKYPKLKALTEKEQPLIAYYDTMAQKVSSHYQEKPAYLAEFLVICVIAEWILGEEKSTHMYPFLNEIDFLELIGKFENNRHSCCLDDKCKISEIQELSFKIVEKLKNYKYKVNKNRISKTR